MLLKRRPLRAKLLLRSNNMRVRLFLATGLALFLAPPAFAEGTSEQRAHCSSDASRLCDEYVPDAIAVEQCLRAHLSQLSPACRSEFGAPARVKKRRRH
jgi:hypothetical protein